jgi:DNA-binding SARP family transcriptional activator
MALVWRIELFGGLRAHRGLEILSDFGTRKADSLLAYLALHPNQALPRKLLAEQLWPDEDYEATRDRFRQALSAVRRGLEPEGAPPNSALIADRAEVRLAISGLSTDVAEWEAALRAAKRATLRVEQIRLLRRVADLYCGELMPGYEEGWIPAARDRFNVAQQEALLRLATLLFSEEEIPAALDYARRAVDCDPVQEEAQCELIRLLWEAGRTVDALRQYEEMERILWQRLRLTPSPHAQALKQQILKAGARAPDRSSRFASEMRPVLSDEIRLAPGKFPPPDGGLPPDSPLYIERPTDQEFADAVGRGDSIVLVKGARQVGKTSLLARGLERARQVGAHVVLTDLQGLAPHLESANTLFFALAEKIVDQLHLDLSLDQFWNPNRLWNVNFDRFLRREALDKIDGRLVWGLDEVDLLFGRSFSAEVFGLFRSWHNERALNPAGPWSRLTLAIAYATEAHLFITDLNQSPFNVGARMMLDDFTPQQTAELNERYNSPLRTAADLERFIALLGGNPYFVQRGLYTLVKQKLDLEAFTALARQEDGLFADPLRRLANALRGDEALSLAVHALLGGETCPSEESFYRLRSAGVIAGNTAREARFRGTLYYDFLKRHFA